MIATETPITAEARATALAERIYTSTIAAMDLFSVYLGDRLGYYRALAEHGPATSTELALRTMTALRLYLSAQTPHNGTSGRPTTKIRELNRPTNASRSASATPISRR